MIEIQENKKVSKSLIKYVEYKEIPLDPIIFRVEVTLDFGEDGTLEIDRDFYNQSEARAFYNQF